MCVVLFIFVVDVFDVGGLLFVLLVVDDLLDCGVILFVVLLVGMCLWCGGCVWLVDVLWLVVYYLMGVCIVECFDVLVMYVMCDVGGWIVVVFGVMLCVDWFICVSGLWLVIDGEVGVDVGIDIVMKKIVVFDVDGCGLLFLVDVLVVYLFDV